VEEAFCPPVGGGSVAPEKTQTQVGKEAGKREEEEYGETQGAKQ